jgi:hypothetical protein
MFIKAVLGAACDDDPMPLHTMIKASAMTAFATVVAMISIFFATGVGQDPLQFVHPSSEYQSLLLANPAALRAAIGFDNLFIAAYTTLFVGLGIAVRREGASRALTFVAGGLLLALGLLDMIENFHFLTMLARAEQGMPPADWEIAAQVHESLFKFHVSYVGMFLLGFAFSRKTAAARWLGNLAWFLQLPVGILIYVAPREIAVPLVFVRFLYFLVAIALSALAYGRPASVRVSAEPGAVGSGALA